MLALHLRLQLLIRDLHLIDLLLQLYLLFIESLLVRVLHALGHVGPRVLVLLRLLVCEIRHALQVLRWLELISGSRLRPRPPPLPERRLHQRGLLHHPVSIARVPLRPHLAVSDRGLRALAHQVVQHRGKFTFLFCERVCIVLLRLGQLVPVRLVQVVDCFVQPGHLVLVRFVQVVDELPVLTLFAVGRRCMGCLRFRQLLRPLLHHVAQCRGKFTLLFLEGC